MSIYFAFYLKRCEASEHNDTKPFTEESDRSKLPLKHTTFFLKLHLLNCRRQKPSAKKLVETTLSTKVANEHQPNISSLEWTKLTVSRLSWTEPPIARTEPAVAIFIVTVFTCHWIPHWVSNTSFQDGGFRGVNLLFRHVEGEENGWSALSKKTWLQDI